MPPATNKSESVQKAANRNSQYFQIDQPKRPPHRSVQISQVRPPHRSDQISQNGMSANQMSRFETESVIRFGEILGFHRCSR